MDSPERWKDISGYEGFYQASTYGRVKSVSHTIARSDGTTQTFPDHMLRLATSQEGYQQVCLTVNRQKQTHAVHRLVLLAWRGAPFPGAHACHGDGDRSNNRLENLRWDSPAGNYADRARHGVFPDPTKPHHTKLTEDAVLAIRIDPRSNNVVAREYGVRRETIAMVRQYKTWQHVGGPHETPEIKAIRHTSQWQRHTPTVGREVEPPHPPRPIAPPLPECPEEWRDMPGFEGRYAVSNHGRVKSLPHTTVRRNPSGTYAQQYSGRMLKISLAGTYQYISLRKEGKGVSLFIHRLVLRTFVGEPPDGHEACHHDGNPVNNHLANLRWDSPINNHADKKRQGTQARGERIGNAKLTADQVRAIRDDPRPTVVVARAYGMTHRNISLIRLRKTWKHI